MVIFVLRQMSHCILSLMQGPDYIKVFTIIQKINDMRATQAFLKSRQNRWQSFLCASGKPFKGLNKISVITVSLRAVAESTTRPFNYAPGDAEQDGIG